LQLPGHDILVAHRPFLQYAYGGHVHERGGHHHADSGLAIGDKQAAEPRR
jgi:hypothetical protein